MKTLGDGAPHAQKTALVLPHENCNDSDFFNLFYQSILSSESLISFETNLLSFIQKILQQATCLFYSNFCEGENKTKFTLQRGSYSKNIVRSRLHKNFPKTIYLESECTQEASPPSDWQNALQVSSLRQNFFAINSLSSNKIHQSILYHFDTSQNSIRCGMLLCSSSEIHGILLYERPLSHPYLNTPLRLQQFQEFIALALLHCQTFNYATLDQLTHLHRKYYFLSHAENQIIHYPNLKYQLLIVDIDFFKNFNDTFGHLEGDRCLQAIAKVIKESIRTCDFSGRFGGEEFICLLQSDLSQGVDIAKRMHHAIKKIKLQDSTGNEISVPTVSIGIANFQADQTLYNLIEQADKALYQAKKDGRNQTVIAQS